MSAGHFIPLVNAARLFASRGVKVTILTTPHNALLFQPTIDDDVRISGFSISIVTVKFPSTQVGLPEGIESFNTATSPEMPHKIFYAISLLQKPMEEKIRELRPDCIFSDTYFPWTVDIAEELNIPRIMYNLSAYMCYCILHNLNLYKPHKDPKLDQSQCFLVPNLPDEIRFKLSQLTEDLRKPAEQRSAFDELLDQVRDSEDRSYGVVHDTFYELEPAYVDYYQKIKKPKCWHFGPISHFASKIRSKELINDHNNNNAILDWLNRKKPRSVLYVSFGSMARFPESQLNEIFQALDASNVPFIFVLRPSEETATWLPIGHSEGKIKNGLLIRGWVPQLTILEHSSIGGFLTHCGTNSVLEAITSGVPMITWPLYADQFYNEKVVEVLGLGVKVGIDVWNSGIEITGPIIQSAKIREAIERLMNNDSEENMNIRNKVMAMSKMADDATNEGGSSWNSLTALIQHIKNFNS